MKSFKTELDLNNQQKTLCARHAGTARHAYNWGLALCKQVLTHNKANPHDKIKFPSSVDLHKFLVATVKVDNPWYYESSKCAPQEALRNLTSAFKRTHQRKVCGEALPSGFAVPYGGRTPLSLCRGTRQQKWLPSFRAASPPAKLSKTVKNSGFPKFKKKNVADSFYLEGSIHVSGDKIKLPVIGWVKCHEVLPSVVPKNVTISKRAGRWFIAFKVEIAPNFPQHHGKPVGIDLGVHHLATCSNGFKVENPKAYRRNKRKLARVQKELSRRLKGGKNREKTKLKLARTHYRISNIRSDTLHKLTTHLAKNHSEIWVEDLNIAGMLKNHKLAAAISDCGFYEFKRQLEYKTVWYGSKLCLVDRWFPSSQLCSGCGAKQPMPLNQRQYDCSVCNLSIDRDLNASINLLNYARIAQPCQPDDGSCSHAPSQELNTISTAVDLGKF